MQKLYRNCIKKLRESNVESPEVLTLQIIQHIFKFPYIDCLSKNITVSKKQEHAVNEIVKAYINGYPLAYVLGEVEFCKKIYHIEQGVLIPRPETEEMVRLATSFLMQLCGIENESNKVNELAKKKHHKPLGKTLCNADILGEIKSLALFECGVGSGIISIEMALAFPDVVINSWDISKKAIDVSKKNCKEHDISCINFHHGDFFDGIEQFLDEKKMNVIISNPPYVSKLEYQNLDSDVLKEPKEALVADNDGCSIIFKLLDLCIKHKAILICEIGYNQGNKIYDHYGNHNIQIKKDISNHDRFLVYVPGDTYTA